MRPLKLLGLAALVALALTVTVGASCASAVTLCKERGNANEECPVGKRFGAREFKAALSGEAILSGAFEVKCTESTVVGKTTQESGSPLPGKITEMTLGACTVCKVEKILNLPYSLGITSGMFGVANGEFRISKAEAGVPGVKLVKCVLATCEFAAVEGKLNLDAFGGEPGQVWAINEPFEYIGGSGEAFCGATATFNATYHMTEPANVWITKNP